MNIEQARSINLEAFIQQLGHSVVAGKGNDNEAWFLSPFRNEKSPSFKVDRRSNKWKDFAEQYWKGDIIDFIQVYADKQGWGTWDTKQALKELDRLAGGLYIPTFKPYQPTSDQARKKETQRYEILKVGRIRSGRLVKYLRSRKIYSHTAKPYLGEIHYYDTRTKKNLYGLCWINCQGGYEMRNPLFKSCIGRKAISIIEVRGDTVPGTAIFEGMLDFLSYLQLVRDLPLARAVVMNSRSLYQTTIAYCLENHQEGALRGFLQNDSYGLETAVKLKEALPSMTIENKKYLGFEDVNDYLMRKEQSEDEARAAKQFLNQHL